MHALLQSSYVVLVCLWPVEFFVVIVNLFFNWRIIAFRNVLFSVKHQHESAIDIHMSPPSRTSLPSHPSSLLQSPCFSSLSHTANSHWLSTLYVVKFPCYYLLMHRIWKKWWYIVSEIRKDTVFSTVSISVVLFSLYHLLSGKQAAVL